VAHIQLSGGQRAEIHPDGFSEHGYVLEIGGAEQSHVDVQNPDYVFYEYLRRIANAVDALAPAGEPIPATECLKDVLGRMLPYWESDIKPDLAAGKTVLVAAHGNSLRSLVKHLEGISDEDIAGLNIPTGIPLYYELDENFKPIKAGEYLDPEAAKDAIAAVANQGK